MLCTKLFIDCTFGGVNRIHAGADPMASAICSGKCTRIVGFNDIFFKGLGCCVRSRLGAHSKGPIVFGRLNHTRPSTSRHGELCKIEGI